MIGRPREIGAAGVEWALAASRAIRPSTRDVERMYREGLRFRDASANWSAAERTEWSLGRLRVVARRAGRETIFWRDRFRSSGFDPESDFTFDDFAHVPPLDRDEAVARRDDMVSAEVPGHLRRRDSTGGSTGVPFTYFTGPEERAWRLSGQDWFARRIGVTSGASTAFLWGHHVDRLEQSALRARVLDTLLARSWFDCFRLSPAILRAYHEELSRSRPRCLVAYASALETLAEVLAEDGLVAPYPTGCIITGAEKLWPDQRAVIEKAFPVPVHERYGGRDVGLVGMQVDPRRSHALDIDWANLFVEPETDEGQTSILITKLNADAMPMFRYRIGDVGAFPSGSRPGWPAHLLNEVIGREADRLFLPDGRWLHGIGIRHTLKDFAVREFQVRQEADYSVELQIVPSTGFSEEEERTILRVLGQNLEGVPLRLTRVSEIARTKSGKWRPVVSAIAGSRQGTPVAR